MTDPLISLADIPSIPHTNNPDETPTTGWRRIQLADDQYNHPPDPPIIQGVLYAGKRHVISGLPESAKTLIAYALLLDALRDEHPVAIVDFEMGPQAARAMLNDLGATIDEIAAIYYIETDRPPTPDELGQLYGIQFVLIDAAAGAYDVTGLDDNARKDVERFAAQWIRPLWQAGVATLLVDHLTKAAEGRGKFTIGSERKIGQADVHIQCEAIKPLTRGGQGLVKVIVHKDRPGFLTRPTHTLVDLSSDPDTHRIQWTLKQPDRTVDGFRPTRLMEKVSRYLEHNPSNRSDIYAHVQGKREGLIAAVDRLLLENHAQEMVPGKKGTEITINRPYREESEESFPMVPDGSGNGPHVSGNVPPPYRGNGNGNDPENDHEWDEELPF